MHYTRLFSMLLLGLVLLSFSACETANYEAGNDYKSIAYNDALAAGIPPQYFVNQINIESGFNPNAISSEGAIGIAQFEPLTAQGLGINPYDPYQSLQGAASLMARYLNKYGDYKMALAAYNCGSGCLQNAINNCGYWYWCIPSVTQRYINEVMS